ncbi:MAG: ribonuclease P protein component [Bacteroidota bacterium]|nr:ribonuclease P protein component [Bacteroidota bacterium]
MSSTINQFTKNERICSDTQIDQLFKQGNAFVCYPFLVQWIETGKVPDPLVKVLISVSKKKLHHAVDRNLAKRQTREAYRQNKHVLYNSLADTGRSLNIAFVWLSGEPVEFNRITRKMCEALDKIAFQIEKVTTI